LKKKKGFVLFTSLGTELINSDYYKGFENNRLFYKYTVITRLKNTDLDIACQFNIRKVEFIQLR